MADYPTVRAYLEKEEITLTRSERERDEKNRRIKEMKKRRQEGKALSREDFDCFQSTVPCLSLSENCCNEDDFTSLNLPFFSELCAITIGDLSCRHVTSFSINGMDKLESIEIGEGCFTLCEDPPKSYSNTSFIISSCPALKTIRIGAMSFADWGEFQLSSTMNDWN